MSETGVQEAAVWQERNSPRCPLLYPHVHTESDVQQALEHRLAATPRTFSFLSVPTTLLGVDWIGSSGADWNLLPKAGVSTW